MTTEEFVDADESGIDQGAPYTVIAGYRTAPHELVIFEREWKRTLARYDVPGAFHANEFFNRGRARDPGKNPYVGWSDKKADSFLAALVDTIAKQDMYPVGGAVDVAAFNAYTYGERAVLVQYLPQKAQRWHRRQTAPYHLAFIIAMSDSLARVHGDVDVHYRFAIQPQYQQRALESWYATKEHDQTGLARHMKDVTFGSPNDHPSMQAADLLAHEFYNMLTHDIGRTLSRERFILWETLGQRRIGKGNNIPLADGPSMERVFDELHRLTPQRRELLRQIVDPNA